MQKEETKELEKTNKWIVGQIPTATKDVIVNVGSQQPLGTEEGIVSILNKIEDMNDTIEKILKKLN